MISFTLSAQQVAVQFKIMYVYTILIRNPGLRKLFKNCYTFTAKNFHLEFF